MKFSACKFVCVASCIHWVTPKSLMPSFVLHLLRCLCTLIRSVWRHFFLRLTSTNPLTLSYDRNPIIISVAFCWTVTSKSIFLLNWGNLGLDPAVQISHQCRVNMKYHLSWLAGNVLPSASQEAVALFLLHGCFVGLCSTCFLEEPPGPFLKEKRERIVLWPLDITTRFLVFDTSFIVLAMGVRLFLDNLMWSWKKVCCSYYYTRKLKSGDNKCNPS